MSGRDEENLAGYLAGLRRSAGLDVEAVCARTKIQARFVEALEAGRWGELPSNTHVRAFSVAIARACGTDGTRAADLALRTLAATAPVPARPGGDRSFDTPAPPPSLAHKAGPEGAPLEPVYAAARREGGEARGSAMLEASARLRALPLGLLLALLGAAGSLSFLAAWSVQRWRDREAAAILAAATPAAATAATAPGAHPAAAVPAPGALGGGPVGRLAPEAMRAYDAASAGASVSASGTAAGADAGAPTSLVLRARRPCWLVLKVDGRPPETLTLADGQKVRFQVDDRAVLLAGNIGALRVWWQGDNLGYLGPLDRRTNGLVFERGHEPRPDPGADLPLPAGIE